MRMKPLVISSRRLTLAVSAVAATALVAAGYSLGQDRDLSSVCRHDRADGGASLPLDPRALAESYARFKDAFGRKMEVSLAKAKRILDEPVDIGLPSCRFSSVKSHRLPFAFHPELRGRELLFVSGDDPAEAGRLATLHKNAFVFVTKARRVGDLGAIAPRPVVIATPELAKSLGIVCTPTLVSISPEGDRIELREGR
ncbi:MAG TPA: hypothetical protein VK661_12100 [Planctomycetota bacterium]|nr:hypothetical protein [Planctomycetota bacterium]